jgi:hypothetical protein
MTKEDTVTDDTELELVQRIRNGETYAQVGRDYGVSRQRIHQIVSKHDPKAAQIGMAVRRAATREQRETALRTILAELPPCRVCFGPIQRLPGCPDARAHTCSPRCANLWQIARFHLDENEWRRLRVAMARSQGRPPPQGPPRSTKGSVYSPRVAAALEEVAQLRMTKEDT